jgi:hypothetical protein
MPDVLLTMVTFAVDGTPQDEEVVAGWTAFALFGLLILAVVVLGFSLTKRLKNAATSAEAGRYDPSDPKPDRPATGLAAAREMRERAAREDADRRE